MDGLTFISKLVEALAWPTVVLVVLLCIRKEFPGIVRSLRKLKFKDVELEFSEGARALAAETRLAVPVLSEGSPEFKERDSNARERVHGLADLSPRAAILEAWLLVESAAAEYLRKQTGTSLSSNPGPLRLLEGLRRAGVLTPPQEAAFEHLRRLRNDAVHAPEAEFTPLAVLDYIESAWAMAVYLEDMARVE